MASASAASNNNETGTLSAFSMLEAASAQGLYYDFFYKRSFMAYLIPMVAAFITYYVMYIPPFRRASPRLRNKLLADR